MPPILQTTSLSVGYNSHPIVHDVTFELNCGDFVGFIGPNGCGKSTLLRGLTGILSPIRGSVSLNGVDIRTLQRRDIAREIAVVPQDTTLQFGFSVLEMVLMGRTPYLRRLQSAGEQDVTIAREALRRTDLLHLEHRSVVQLSGGERQRAVIARGLTQEPSLLLLDEPDSHLDIGHQIEVFDLLRDLNNAGTTILCVSHDLNLAASYARSLVLMLEGGIVASGTPSEILTKDHLRTVYGVDASVMRHPVTGAPQVTPLAYRKQPSPLS